VSVGCGVIYLTVKVRKKVMLLDDEKESMGWRRESKGAYGGVETVLAVPAQKRKGCRLC